MVCNLPEPEDAVGRAEDATLLEMVGLDECEQLGGIAVVLVALFAVRARGDGTLAP